MELTEEVLTTAKELKEQAEALSPAVWVMNKKIILPDGPFTFKDHEYLFEPYTSDTRIEVTQKATQGGFSLLETIVNLHGCIYGKYPAGVAVVMPNNDVVSKFSRAKYNPLIALNRSAIGKYVKSGGKGTDSMELKKVGNSHIHFVSATLSQSLEGEKVSAASTSFTCDKLVFDELDMMNMNVIENFDGRMHHSKIRQKRFLSNPTAENYGINALFNDSDQRYWHNLCHACGKYTNAALEFLRNPENIIQQKDGKGILVCVHCKTPLHLYYLDKKTGKESMWVALYPNKPIIGRLWSGLNSVYYDPYEIMQKYYEPPEGNFKAVMRNTLGFAYTAKEDQLRKSDVFDCCTNEPMSQRHDGPCAMGVDVGIKKHVTIGCRTAKDRYEILKTITVDTWNQVHDLAKIFNVKEAGIDIAPDIDAAKQFQKSEPYRVWLVDYKTSRHVSISEKDATNHIIKANRTEICDATHRLFTQKLISLPRRELMDEFVEQVCNPFKQEIRNEKTGVPEYRYVGKNDHFRHSLNYFYLVAKDGRMVKSSLRNRTEEKFVLNNSERYI